MKRCILSLVLILLLTFTLVGNCVGWLSGWDYRIELSIADYAGDIGASVTWFPVTVFLTATQGDCVFDELAADGNRKKIAFTKADGTTELYGEIEKWDDGNELAIIHVSRDGWTIDANTSIYMYYDKDHADNSTYIGDIGSRTEVWDGNFKAVYHMPDLTTSTIEDATSNSYNGTKASANNPLETTSGKVGNAQLFSSDYIALVDDGLDFGTGDYSIETIIKTASGTAQYIIGKRDGDTRWFFELTNDVTDGVYFHLKDGTNGVTAIGTRSKVVDNTFHYVAGTADRDSATGLNLYFDGSLEATANPTSVGSITNTVTAEIGRVTGQALEYFDGIIDEIRISDSVRSTAWLKGTYNSLWDTLLTYGSEESIEVEVNAIFFGANF